MISVGVIQAILTLKDTMSPALVKAALNVKKAGASFKKIGKSLLPLSIGLALVGGAAIKFAADFDQAMTQSLAIMGDLGTSTQQEFDEMRDVMETTAREVAKTTTFSATQAAESYFFLASAGLDAATSIKALPMVANFAQAGMFDMATATDLLTDAQSALGLVVRDSKTGIIDTAASMMEMARVSDVLVKANTLANASVEQFSIALTTKAGASLKIVNKDIEEGVAVLAAFADQGVKAQDAGTGLSIIMRDLSTKAIKNRSEWNELGVAVFDATGDMNNMGNIIQGLETRLDGMSDETKKATLLNLGFSDRSVIFIQSLLGMGDQIVKYEAELRKAGGTTEEVAEKQLQSFINQLSLSKSRMIDVGIELGQNLMPVFLDFVNNSVEPAIEKLAEMATAFSELEPEERRAKIEMVAFAAALGPAIFLLGAFIEKAAIVTGVISKMVVAIGAWPIAITAAVGVAFGALAKYSDAMDAAATSTEKTGDILDSFKFGTEISERAEDMARSLGLVDEQGNKVTNSFSILQQRLVDLGLSSDISSVSAEELARALDLERGAAEHAALAAKELADNTAFEEEKIKALTGELASAAAAEEDLANAALEVHGQFSNVALSIDQIIGAGLPEELKTEIQLWGEAKQKAAEYAEEIKQAAEEFKRSTEAKGILKMNKELATWRDTLTEIKLIPLDEAKAAIAATDAAIVAASDITVTWGDNLQNVSDMFRILGIDATSSLGSILSSTLQINAAFDLLTEESQKVFDAMDNMQKGMFAVQAAAQGIGSVMQATSSGTAGERALKGGVAGAGAGMQAGAVFGPLGAGIGAAVGAAAGAITGWIRGKSFAAAMDTVKREFGFAVSEGLLDAIRESGKPASLMTAAIFEEGIAAGTADVDGLAKKMGDLFSEIQFGNITESEGITALQDALPLLLQNFEDLGVTGEAEVQRIIAAAQEMGIEFEGLTELIATTLTDEALEAMGLAGVTNVQAIRDAAEGLGVGFDVLKDKILGTFAPQSLEQMMETLGLTNAEARALAETLGVDVATNLQLAALSANLTVKEFKDLQEVAGAVLGKDTAATMEELQALMEATGLSAQELAERLGVDVAEGAGNLNDEIVNANDGILDAASAARQLEEALAAAARAAGRIHIPSSGNLPSGGDIPSFAHGGFVPETFPAGAIVRVAEPGTGGEDITPRSGAREALASDSSVSGADSELKSMIRDLPDVIQKAVVGGMQRSLE